MKKDIQLIEGLELEELRLRLDKKRAKAEAAIAKRLLKQEEKRKNSVKYLKQKLIRAVNKILKLEEKLEKYEDE